MVALSSTASVSCAAVTVTVCGARQFDVEKVSEAGAKVTSLLPVFEGVTVTDAVGWESSFTV